MAAPTAKSFHWGASIFVPLFVVSSFWLVHFLSQEFGVAISHYGLKPRSASGLMGIITMPFIHSSWSHLMNNSIPMLVLGWALFHFYPTLAWKTLIGITLLGGAWLWISGRDSYHIGASGVVYGLAAFLFLSGWLRKEKRVAALSLLVAFLYGSLWWGILPIDPSISWEGHLWGALSGFALAVAYRKQGPQKPVYVWPEEEAPELEISLPKYPGEIPSIGLHDNQHSTSPQIRIIYIQKPPQQKSGDSSEQAEKG